MTVRQAAARAVTLCCLLLAPAPLTAQTQNLQKTGSGSVLDTLDSAQTEFDKHWSGRPGQLVKGSVGIIGIAQALTAAKDAVTSEGGINAQGDIKPFRGNAAVVPGGPMAASATSAPTGTN